MDLVGQWNYHKVAWVAEVDMELGGQDEQETTKLANGDGDQAGNDEDPVPMASHK